MVYNYSYGLLIATLDLQVLSELHSSPLSTNPLLPRRSVWCKLLWAPCLSQGSPYEGVIRGLYWILFKGLLGGMFWSFDHGSFDPYVKSLDGWRTEVISRL